MSNKINYTRIKKIVHKMTDLRVSSDLYPVIEIFLIEKLNDILEKANELRKASKRKTLFLDDLKLSSRYTDIGKERSLALSELRSLILEKIGNDKYLQKNVIETLRGYLIEELRLLMIKVIKLAKHNNYKTLKADHFKFYYTK